MDLRLVYTNHYGESIEIGGDGHLHLMTTDLFDHEWGWRAEGSSLVSSIQPRQISLPIGMFGGSLAERTRAFEVLEADVACDELGTLSCNGYSLRCAPVGASLGAWWFADGIEERTVKLVAPRPLWSKDVEHIFSSRTPESGDWLDFEYDLPTDLLGGSRATTIDVGTVGPAEWRWVAYGPVANPYVIIDGNRYEVGVAVPEGSRLELDTRDRTVTVISQQGEAANVFDKRMRGADGSGTYAFRPLPRGTVGVIADSSLSFDVVIHDERMEPAWA